MKINTKKQHCTKLYKTISQEISETDKVIDTNPTDLSGYLHVAKLYSCQGNQQNALLILEKGMNAISSPADKLALRQQMDIIYARRERRIDFLTQCPYEIIHNIIIQLDNCYPKAKYRCIDVSRAWQRKFLSFQYLWKNLSFDDDLLMAPNYPLRVLPYVDKLAERLYLHGSFGICMKLFENYKFFSLKRLELIFSYGITNQTSSAQLLQLHLTRLATTLTEIKINIRQIKSLSLYHLLTWLPHLTSVKLHVDTLSDVSLPSDVTVPAALSNLTWLEIRTATFVPLIVIESFLRRAHNLRVLGLQCFRDDVNVLSLIGGNCPKLEVIRVQADIVCHEYLTVHKKKQEVRIPDQYIGSCSPNDSACQVMPEGTLRIVELMGVETTIPLTSRLEKSRDTLRAMILRMSERSTDAPLVHWQPLSAYTMNALAYLQICDGRLSIYRHLPAILRQYPALETLHFQNTPYWTDSSYNLDDEIWVALGHAVAQLPRLTTLKLENVKICDAGFERFLERIQQESQIIEVEAASSGRRCGLQDFQIISCQGITIPMIRNIANIKTLQSLAIVCHPITTMNSYNVIEFLRLAKTGLPKLQFLELAYIEVSELVATAIVESWNKNLKLLTLGHGCQFYNRESALQKILQKNSEIYKCIKM